MGRSCCYFGCKNYVHCLKDNRKQLKFYPFPKPKTNLVKCQRWIVACRPPEENGSFIDKISKNSYICSAHFAGGNGPTEINPDPFGNQIHTIPSVFAIHQIVTPPGWSLERLLDDTCIFAKKRNGTIILQCTITPSLEFNLTILDTPAPYKILDLLPKFEILRDVPPFLDAINQLNVCPGNPDEIFIQPFLQTGNSVKGRYCDKAKAIYSVHCELISKKTRCSNCSLYRATLRKLYTRKEKRSLIDDDTATEEPVTFKKSKQIEENFDSNDLLSDSESNSNVVIDPINHQEKVLVVNLDETGENVIRFLVNS